MKKPILIFFSLIAIVFVQAKSYNIKLITENNEFEFVCDNDQTIYEAAKLHGVKFNYEYDGGATDLSIAKLNYGIVDMSKQSYLNARQIEEKLILLTVSYPKSDCEIDVNIPKNTKKHKITGRLVPGNSYNSRPITEDNTSSTTKENSDITKPITKNNTSSTITVNKLPEKDMPYLEVKESELKSTNPEEDKRKAQIAFSAYKRGIKYVILDTLNFELIYPIKSGDEINISPLLNEYMESHVYNSNIFIQTMFKEQPEHTELLKQSLITAHSKERRKNLTFVDGSHLPEWSVFVGIIKKYREDIKK